MSLGNLLFAPNRAGAVNDSAPAASNEELAAITTTTTPAAADMIAAAIAMAETGSEERLGPEQDPPRNYRGPAGLVFGSSSGLPATSDIAPGAGEPEAGFFVSPASGK